ncbi:XdhC family protein [Formosa haliotis]|uniref:XdhC family protein n=1 Tax=Formosa haliotis TaxID=1555194 RepID=UPI0008240231|nr:XdhC/CoxI family protein [Formosa haliotis]
MTFEFKHIIDAYLNAKQKHLDCVLATVVHLEGSSYRKPGVRMLIKSNGGIVGAVSGGCVEQEVKRQSDSVFKTAVPKVMTYDGRYRLGCEGILYILIEPFSLDLSIINKFRSYLKQRIPIQITSLFSTEVSTNKSYGSYFLFRDEKNWFSKYNCPQEENKLMEFKDILPARFRLIIFGTEHDTVQLCKFAHSMGWETVVVAGLSEHKSLNDFPGANELLYFENIDFNALCIDKLTAIVLMSHNYARDLRNLLALKHTLPIYIGLLGPVKRREKLISEVLELQFEMLDEAFLDVIYGPAGLNIGAETPQEIAVSIVSEILSVVRQQHPISLREKTGHIHA